MTARDVNNLTDHERYMLYVRRHVCHTLRRNATATEIAHYLGEKRMAVYQVYYRLAQRGHLVRRDGLFHAPDDRDWSAPLSLPTLEGSTAESSLRLVIELVGSSRTVIDSIDAAIERLTEMRRAIQGDYRRKAS